MKFEKVCANYALTAIGKAGFLQSGPSSSYQPSRGRQLLLD